MPVSHNVAQSCRYTSSTIPSQCWSQIWPTIADMIERHQSLVRHFKRSTMAMRAPEFGNPSDLGLLPEIGTSALCFINVIAIEDHPLNSYQSVCIKQAWLLNTQSLKLRVNRKEQANISLDESMAVTWTWNSRYQFFVTRHTRYYLDQQNRVSREEKWVLLTDGLAAVL